MSITDELREYADRLSDEAARKSEHGFSPVAMKLEGIADRIDAEHESDVSTACRLAAGLDDDALAKRGYIALPVDADGEYIHVGDVMYGYGKTIEVVELRYGRSGWVLISRDGNGYADTFAFTHYHAPTVEDVLDEFANAVLGCDNTEESVQRVIAEFAKRLTLAGDAE